MIIEFLNSVLAEEEQLAQQTATWLQPPWCYDPEDDPEDDRTYDANDVMVTLGACAPYVAHWDPARVLNLVGALRRIVELHTPDHWPEKVPAVCPTCSTWDVEVAMGDHPATPVGYPCPTLRVLALPYSHHPDYREEWAP